MKFSFLSISILVFLAPAMSSASGHREIELYNAKYKKTVFDFARIHEKEVRRSTLNFEYSGDRIVSSNFIVNSGEACTSFDSMYRGRPTLRAIDVLFKCYRQGTTKFYGTESIVDTLTISL